MKKGGQKRTDKMQHAERARRSELYTVKRRTRKTSSHFFGRTCGRSWNKYHYLALFLALSATFAYFAIQRNTTPTKGNSQHKRPNNRPHSEPTASGRGLEFDPVYLNTTSRGSVDVALSTPGYNLTALVRMMHEFSYYLASPGELIFPMNIGGRTEYRPLPFCQIPDGMHRRGSEMQNYLEARQWLHNRRNFDKMTPKQFVATLKMFNRKIVGGKHDIHDFRNQIVWNVKDINGGLFDSTNNLQNVLNERDLEYAKRIREKVHYICNNIMQADSGDNKAYFETVLMDLYTGDLLKKIQQEGHPDDAKEVEKRQLTHIEKRIVRKIYDIKENITPEEQAKLYEKDFAEWQAIPNRDIVKKVGMLHFFILKRHGFTDGNGRSARGMTDEYLEQHGLPPVFYPSGDEYRKTVSQSMAQNDPNILIEFFRKHIDARKYLESMRLAGDIQRECIVTAGGTTECDTILLNIMSGNGPGFC